MRNFQCGLSKREETTGCVNSNGGEDEQMSALTMIIHHGSSIPQLVKPLDFCSDFCPCLDCAFPQLEISAYIGA